MQETTLERFDPSASTHLDSILDAWRAGQPDAILATVIETRGSVERRVGARVLLPADSQTDPAAKVAQFDMTSGDPAVTAFGLDIDGWVRVWMESLTTPNAAATIEFLDGCRNSRCECVVATVLDVGDCARMRPGDRLFVTATGASGNLLGTPLERELLRHARVSLSERKNQLVFLGDCEVWLEWAGPPMPLVIFGSGPDQEDLVLAAREQGFLVTAAEPTDHVGPSTSVLLVLDDSSDVSDTNDDDVNELAASANQLAAIAVRKPRFLPVLGPKARTDRLLREIEYDPPIFIVRSSAGDPVAVAAEIKSALHRCDREGRELPERRPLERTVSPMHLKPLPEPATEPA